METATLKRRLARVAGLVAILASIALAAGVAKSFGHPEDGSAGKLTTVNVVVVPSYDEAALFLGAKLGFFAKRGIAIHAITAANGPAGIALVQSGSADLGLIAYGPLLVTASHGLPLKIVTVTSTEQNLVKAGTSNVGFLTRPESGIARWRDIAGKSVGVFSLASLDAICIKLAVTKDGGDAGKINFVALPAADLGPSMDQKQVDGIEVADPFLTQFLGQFHPREIGDPCGFVIPKNTPRVLLYTTQANASSKRVLLTNFALAMKKSILSARAHVPALKAQLSKYAIVPPELVSKLRPPSSLNSVWNVTAATSLENIFFDNGLITSRPDIATLAPMVP